MPSTNLGKVSVTPKGAWSGSTAYEILDIVSNGGSSYLAITSVPAGTALTNTSYWLMIASKGDKGNTGEINGASASISGGYGTPSVSVTEGGTSTDRSYAFAFSNLKGNGIASIEIEETATVGNVHTYTLTATLDSGETETCTFDVTDGAVTSVNGRTGAVTGLAEQDGYYDEMTVGGAEQLISSTYVTDSVPYVFRTSGGSADIGDREFDEIHGGTIAWNQLVPNNTWDSTQKAFPQGTSFVEGHKLLFYGTWKKIDSEGGALQVHFYNKPTSDPSESTRVIWENNGGSKVYSLQKSNIANGTVNTVGASWIYLGNMSNQSDIVLNCIDLTQMFGSAIADYLYALDQNTAGAGYAWFKSLFPKPYYAYNAGSLISITGLSAHKMTGFNQWDEDWEVGYINLSTGENQSANDRIRSKNYNPCLPNTAYYLLDPTDDSNIRIFYYDAQKNYVGDSAWKGNTVVTTPSNAYYFRFIMGTAYGTVYHNDICINLAWDGERNGEYEAYEVHEYALDYDVTLRGIPKLDADNKLYYDGDVYASDGTVQRRYGIVDLGTLTWTWTNSKWQQTSISGIKYVSVNTVVGNAIAQNYKMRIASGMSSASVGEMAIDTNNVKVVTASSSDKPSGYLVYELDAPTTESADPYTSPQWVSDWGTEEYVIAEQSGVAMPVGHETKYTANLKAKLEMAPNSPSNGNGKYVVQQTNGINEYVPLENELPTAPAEDGTYVLKAVVSGGTTTLSWEIQS